MDRLRFSSRWLWVAWLLVLTASGAIVGLDVQHYRAVLSEQLAQSDEMETNDRELESRRGLVVGRNQARVDIAWDVINGRTTLIDAIDRYRSLESSRPEFLPLVSAADGYSTDDPRLVDLVCLYVEQALTREPERREAVLDRLKREWREHSSGGVRSVLRATGP